MTVLTRNKRGEKGIRRLRQSVAPFTPPRSVEPAVGPAGPASPPTAHPPRSTEPPTRDDGAPGRRALHGPVQDNAVYSCECGFVFSAAVSTSVDCPHCGGSQAW